MSEQAEIFKSFASFKKQKNHFSPYANSTCSACLPDTWPLRLCVICERSTLLFAQGRDLLAGETVKYKELLRP